MTHGGTCLAAGAVCVVHFARCLPSTGQQLDLYRSTETDTDKETEVRRDQQWYLSGRRWNVFGGVHYVDGVRF